MRSALNKDKPPAPASDDLDELRGMLEDFALIAGHLAPLCSDPSHMIEVAQKALEDESSLRFLANVLRKAAGK